MIQNGPNNKSNRHFYILFAGWYGMNFMHLLKFLIWFDLIWNEIFFLYEIVKLFQIKYHVKIRLHLVKKKKKKYRLLNQNHPIRSKHDFDLFPHVHSISNNKPKWIQHSSHKTIVKRLSFSNLYNNPNLLSDNQKTNKYLYESTKQPLVKAQWLNQ